MLYILLVYTLWVELCGVKALKVTSEGLEILHQSRFIDDTILGLLGAFATAVRYISTKVLGALIV